MSREGIGYHLLAGHELEGMKYIIIVKSRCTDLRLPERAKEQRPHPFAKKRDHWRSAARTGNSGAPVQVLDDLNYLNYLTLVEPPVDSTWPSAHKAVQPPPLCRIHRGFIKPKAW